MSDVAENPSLQQLKNLLLFTVIVSAIIMSYCDIINK
jgi:hypothetical protein